MDVTLLAELKSADDYIICHAMCDDIGELSIVVTMDYTHHFVAGTARQAEVHPDVPSHLFPAKPREVKNTGNVQKPPEDIAQVQSRKLFGNKPKSRTEFDDFDGDDLQLDDFLTAVQRREKAKKSHRQTEYQVEEMDWLSIDSTPSPQRRPETSKAKAGDWIADMGPLDDEESGPVRLPNGNWACNHKCKDKTRYEHTKNIKNCAYPNSCKHFCCRDGLEKPPKPNKSRTVPNDKSSGLNQLTLPAAINKRDTPNDAPKKGQASKPNTVTKRKSSNLSATKYSTAQNGRKSSFQDQLRTKPTSNKKARTIEKKRQQSPLKISSSDFDDDSFADLPSPSKLLAGSARKFAKSPSPKTGTTQPGETDNASIDPRTLSTEGNDQGVILHDSTRTVSGALDTATTVHTNQNIRHPRPPKRPYTFDIWTDDVSDFENDVFTNPNILLNSSATTSMPFAPSSANTTRSLKRKARALKETHGNLPAQSSLQASPETTQRLNTLAAQESIPSEIEAHTPLTLEDAPTGWEDVDRLMLEEFGRFIDFT